MEENEDVLQFMSYERWLFNFMGVYNLRNGVTFFVGTKRFIVFFFTWLIMVSMVIKLITGVDSIEEFTEVLYFFSTQAAFISKLTNFVYGPGNLQKFEDHLRKPLPQKYFNIFGREDLHALMKHCAFIGRLYRWLVGTILVLFAFFPLLDADKDLPVSGYTFIDISHPINKTIVYIMQVVAVNISGLLSVNCDMFAAYVISIGVANLRLIKKCFRHVDYSSDGELSKRNKFKRYLKPTSLGELYDYHLYIIEYFTMVENLLSLGIFVQFLDSVLVVCMTGFQIMVTPAGSSQFIFLIVYGSGMLAQVSIYCWFGNEIMVESDDLGEACYMSNWYEGTLSEKKSIFLIMERSKRLLSLTAGKFFTVSLPTLVAIFKTAYSYFAVLQQYYKDQPPM